HKIVELMSSQTLLSAQLHRWIESRRVSASDAVDDVAVIQKEFSELKEQTERLNRAYGSGLFSLEQLREYTDPLKGRMATLEAQLVERGAKKQSEVNTMPTKDEIELFAHEARGMLHNLNFTQRRAIVIKTVEKVVATFERVKVYGYIP